MADRLSLPSGKRLDRQTRRSDRITKMFKVRPVIAGDDDGGANVSHPAAGKTPLEHAATSKPKHQLTDAPETARAPPPSSSSSTTDDRRHPGQFVGHAEAPNDTALSAMALALADDEDVKRRSH